MEVEEKGLMPFRLLEVKVLKVGSADFNKVQYLFTNADNQLELKDSYKSRGEEIHLSFLGNIGISNSNWLHINTPLHISSHISPFWVQLLNKVFKPRLMLVLMKYQLPFPWQ